MKEACAIPALAGRCGRAVSAITPTKCLPPSTRSPLRYPGGKFRAVNVICSYIPRNTKKLASPFLGGGSVELACSAQGIKVYGADGFKPLINFWKEAKKDPVLLSERVGKYYPLSKPKFYSLQKGYIQIDDSLEKAAVFFVLNRSSFSGTTLSGGMSPGHPRFNSNAINRLRAFKAINLYIKWADYKNTIHAHADKLLYLDPPYANGEKLYGAKGDMHEGFNHQELADELKKRDGWILSYNNCSLIRKLYKKFKILKPRWNYGMSVNKKSKELLIINV